MLKCPLWPRGRCTGKGTATIVHRNVAKEYTTRETEMQELLDNKYTRMHECKNKAHFNIMKYTYRIVHVVKAKQYLHKRQARKGKKVCKLQSYKHFVKTAYKTSSHCSVKHFRHISILYDKRQFMVNETTMFTHIYNLHA